MPPTQSEPTIQPGPTPPQSQKHWLLYLLATIGTLALIGLCTGAGFWLHSWYDNHQKQVALDHQKTVQQGFIDLLSARTIQQQARYTDSQYHTTTYRIASDFGDSGYPITKGTITVEYDYQGRHLGQTMEFVAFKGTDQADELYFRMTDGAAITNAPTNWFFGLQRDIRSLKAFQNFWWYKYDQINSSNGTIVTGNLWSSDFKDKIIDDIRHNTAYVLTSCQATKHSTWCNGQLNQNGLNDIDHYAGISAAQGRNDSADDLGDAKFTVWTNTGQAGISRIIYTQPKLDYTQQDVSHDYWGLNQPVDVRKPQNAQNAPILGGYRATIDSPCSALCQKQLSQEEADRLAGHYY